MRVSDILLDLSHVRLKMANIRFQPHDATDRLSRNSLAHLIFPVPDLSGNGPLSEDRRCGLTDCGPPAGPLRGRVHAPALQPVFAMPQCSSRRDVRVSEPDHEFCLLEMFSQETIIWEGYP
jgi:hypothetical protein